MNEFDDNAANAWLSQHWLEGAIISAGYRVFWVVSEVYPWTNSANVAAS